jgi:hypothetical protein
MSTDPFYKSGTPPSRLCHKSYLPRNFLSLQHTLVEDSMEGPIPLTAREAASGLLGSVSMTCWFFLLVRLRRTSKVGSISNNMLGTSTN